MESWGLTQCYCSGEITQQPIETPFCSYNSLIWCVVCLHLVSMLCVLFFFDGLLLNTSVAAIVLFLFYFFSGGGYFWACLVLTIYKSVLANNILFCSAQKSIALISVCRLIQRSENAIRVVIWMMLYNS